MPSGHRLASHKVCIYMQHMKRHFIRIGQRRISLPGSRIARLVIGILLVFLGFLGFLPILGFWMIPLGLLVLSVDSPLVRRWRRRSEVTMIRRWRNRGRTGTAR